MRRRDFIGAAVLTLWIGAGHVSAQDRTPEYQVKAAFLSKFGSFVEWPASAFPDARSPVQLCVVGRDPFGDTLDRLAQGQTVNMRSLRVRRISVIAPNSGCHIAFLGGSAAQSPSDAVRAASGAPVLTVADGPIGEPVGIQFVIQANRVRFQIDQRASAGAGLGISSKLLNLAVAVIR